MNPILAALQTAEIAVNEIGLKRDGIIAILMQTSVIDGYQTIEDIQKKYGDSVAHIISGLLRIHDLYKRNPIIESENFRNLLISFSEDMRVILIMIADRVNVMRQIRDTDQKEAKHQGLAVLAKIGLQTARSVYYLLYLHAVCHTTRSNIRQIHIHSIIRNTQYEKEFFPRSSIVCHSRHERERRTSPNS